MAEVKWSPIDLSIFLDFFDNDPLDDHFLRNPFGNIFGPTSIFGFEEIFDKQCDAIEDYVLDDPELKSIPHDFAITQSKTCFSQKPIIINLIGSASKITATAEDTTMGVVRVLMFEDDYILVAPSLVPHGKWGEHELDYFVRDLALHPNPKEIVDVK